MRKINARKFVLMLCLAVTTGLLMSALVEAAETGQAAAPAPKAVKKGKKVQAGKKDQNQGAVCSFGSKKWREGQHCMAKCNEQGNSCDMSICKSGEWKPYSSCFGPKAVTPNCPPACE